MVSAALDESGTHWTLTTADGDVLTARFCLMATGSLSAAMTPDIPGLAEFAGEVYHTAHWPHEPVDFTGQEGRGHRHRIIWHPIDSDHRRASRAPFRLSAHRELQRPGRQQAPVARGSR